MPIRDNRAAGNRGTIMAHHVTDFTATTVPFGRWEIKRSAKNMVRCLRGYGDHPMCCRLNTVGFNFEYVSPPSHSGHGHGHSTWLEIGRVQADRKHPIQIPQGDTLPWSLKAVLR
uniref:Uncharacterized protein n=1 Tax=Eutreptiella gymnastica TaxID=73025 RepID=A0A7S4CC28_9EUGL